MPLILPDNHPAFNILKKEGHDPAIRGNDPIRIAVLNLMPDKATTELDLLRMLSVPRLMVETTWIRTETYHPKNTDPAYLERFYQTFSEVGDQPFDGMIITGAPVEHLDFEEVIYWQELVRVMDWATDHVAGTLYICWAAQAVLYHRYGIAKVPLEEKLSGVYTHQAMDPDHPLLQGIPATFRVPQSRYTGIPDEEVRQHPELHVLARSDRGGIHLLEAPAINGICMTGHPEYNALTLAREYERDLKKGIVANVPENYFEGGDPARGPVFSWHREARLFYSNWLNHIRKTCPSGQVLST